MQKIIIFAALLVCSAMILNGCSSVNMEALKPDGITIELGDEVSNDPSVYVYITKSKLLDEVVVDTSDVDTGKVGAYTVAAAYKNIIREIPVFVVDTTAPLVELKDEEFNYEAGEWISSSDIIDKIVELDTYTVEFRDNTYIYTENLAGISQEPELPDDFDDPEVAYMIYEAGGTYENAVVITDASGNQTEASFSVEIKDPDVPQITGLKDLKFRVGDTVTKAMLLEGVEAFDETDGDLTEQIEVSMDELNTRTAGEYQVTFSVTNSSDITTTETITVTVEAAEVNLNTGAVGDTTDDDEDETNTNQNQNNNSRPGRTPTPPPAEDDGGDTDSPDEPDNSGNDDNNGDDGAGETEPPGDNSEGGNESGDGTASAGEE